MKKNINIFFTFLFLFLNTHYTQAFEIKKLNPFKKKPQEPKAKMVETKQEWDIESINIPLEERDLDKEIKKEKTKEEIKKEKQYHKTEQKYIFEKYNYPQGKRNLNIEDIKKNLYSYPYLVADSNFQYVAYSRYYFSPDLNQISSEFFVEKLDTTKSQQERILKYKHQQKNRKPIIQAGMNELYPNLFKGLTLVDWSKDSKKLLIKEKVGSLNNGIYKTYLYIYIMPSEDTTGHILKLGNLDEVIKNYFLDYQNLKLVRHQYNIEPLGFSSQDDNTIIFHCFTYNTNNKKIFLGTWGYDYNKNEVILYSKTNPSHPVSANGLLLKEVID